MHVEKNQEGSKTFSKLPSYGAPKQEYPNVKDMINFIILFLIRICHFADKLLHSDIF